MVSELRWLDPVEDRAWRGWVSMTELLKAQIGRDLQHDCDMSEADYAVLATLSECPEKRLRMNELADTLGWSKSRLSHQIGRMERRALVERTCCPYDARGMHARLTDTGQQAVEAAAPLHLASVRRNLIDLLDREQLGVMAEVAAVVVKHLLAERALEQSGAEQSGAERNGMDAGSPPKGAPEGSVNPPPESCPQPLSEALGTRPT